LIIANFLSRAALLASVNAGQRSPKLLSWSIRFVIWILAISMALEELGLARQTVIAAFSIVFGASMLGLAIAFGLGGQDLARRALERHLGDTQKEKYKEPQPL
jgi:small-conductance mechanosensitive channel